MPSHSHTVYTDDDFCAFHTGNNNEWKQGLVNINTPSTGMAYQHFIGAIGGNQSHNIIQPVVASYCWRRTA